MKKTIVTLLLSLFCMIVQGQTHMKFMGIPLNGNVELFTQKLKAKGLTCDVAKTKASPSGVKIYKGVFMGEDSEFMICFNPKDKNVFAVEVSINYPSLDLAKIPFTNILKHTNSTTNNVYPLISQHFANPGMTKRTFPTCFYTIISNIIIRPSGYITI